VGAGVIPAAHEAPLLPAVPHHRRRVRAARLAGAVDAGLSVRAGHPALSAVLRVLLQIGLAAVGLVVVAIGESLVALHQPALAAQAGRARVGVAARLSARAAGADVVRQALLTAVRAGVIAVAVERVSGGG